jgi:hypothetical protein
MTTQLHAIWARCLRIPQTLELIGDWWCQVQRVAEDARMLNLQFPTRVTAGEGETVEIVSTMLLPGLRSKVLVSFTAVSEVEHLRASVQIQPRARVVYGEGVDDMKMQKFLARRVPAAGGPDLRGMVQGLAGMLHA